MTPLSNFDIEKMAVAIPHFQGVFMCDALLAKINNIECGIVN